MSYSNFHKSRNPFSPARLDEAFKASKIEGGPGDPVRVSVEKDVDAGKVTVSTYSEGGGKAPKLNEAQKKWRDQQIAELGSVEAYREKYNIKAPKEREVKSSYTYELLKSEDAPDIKPMDLDYDIEMADPPEEYTREETEKDTVEPSKGKTKTAKDKFRKPGTKDKSFSFTTSGGDGLSDTEMKVSCKMDPDAANKEVCKQAAKAQKEAKKSSMYKVKKDGTQKIKKKLVNPADYLYGRGWRQGRGFMKNVQVVTRKQR